MSTPKPTRPGDLCPLCKVGIIIRRNICSHCGLNICPTCGGVIRIKGAKLLTCMTGGKCGSARITVTTKPVDATRKTE